MRLSIRWETYFHQQGRIPAFIKPILHMATSVVANQDQAEYDQRCYKIKY